MTSWVMPVTDPALDSWLRQVAFEAACTSPRRRPPTWSSRRPSAIGTVCRRSCGSPAIRMSLAMTESRCSPSVTRFCPMPQNGCWNLAIPARSCCHGRRRTPPSPDVLLAALRESVGVDHGRVDATGAVTAVRHVVVRVGALVTFELSAEDRFQEQAERWVDGPSRRLLPPAVTDRLARAAVEPAGTDAALPELTDGIWGAVAGAHRLIDTAAAARRSVLAGEVDGAHQAERSSGDPSVPGLHQRRNVECVLALAAR
jgi:hypothetical protein